MEFDEYVKKYIKDEEAYVASAKPSVLHQKIAQLTDILAIGTSPTHPFRILHEQPTTPQQRAAVLEGVIAQKKIDHIDDVVEKEFPGASVHLRGRALHCLLEQYTLRYQQASEEFYREEKKKEK
jgi:hypothetical protein